MLWLPMIDNAWLHRTSSQWFLGKSMTRLINLIFLITLGLCELASAQRYSTANDMANAVVAYDDLVARFWDGTRDRGYLRRYAAGSIQYSGLDSSSSLCKGCLWEYGMGANALYAHWKANGSTDALARLQALWSWLKANWSLSEISSCGVGTTSTAQDDAAWGANSMLQLAEASHDPAAVTYAQAILDCAWNRWHDTATGGGLWYDDSRTVKSSYQAPYAYAALRYYEITGDKIYMQRAQSLATWSSAVLARSDGLYWESIDSNGTPRGSGQPNHIRKGSSVTFLAGNMAWAALNARLYTLTGTNSYRCRVLATAAGIKSKQTVSSDILLNDRDAFTNGWSAYYYAANVLPLLSTNAYADVTTLLQTGRSAAHNARGPDGTYSGDWDGPFYGTWANAGSHAHRLTVTANAMIWIIVAASLSEQSR